MGLKTRKIGFSPSSGVSPNTIFGSNHQKNTFAATCNQREYFETYIRPHNKVLFGKRKPLDKSDFVVYEKDKKDDFKERVQKYLNDIIK